MTEFTYCIKPYVFHWNKVYKLVLYYAINRLFTGIHLKSRTVIAEMNEMSSFIGSNKYFINLYSQRYTKPPKQAFSVVTQSSSPGGYADIIPFQP